MILRSIRGTIFNRIILQFKPVRYVSSLNTIVTENLADRSVIRIAGDEVLQFLQGLVTNDVRHLEDGAKSMYTMFLNDKGRVLYDAIIYPSQKENIYLIECDKSGVAALKKHLTIYKVRRKINIETLGNDCQVWVLNNTNPEISIHDSNDKLIASLKKNPKFEECLVAQDPRVPEMGVRVVAPEGVDMISELQVKSGDFYKQLRYKLGVGEGLQELPPGNCFPLEANADYLHGVSFHKGCYIGQELTARTHHTGVIRKRLMPLIFEKSIEFQADAIITPYEGSKNLGKLRGVDKNIGIGLVRIDEALKAGKLKVNENIITTYKPTWWPSELPKEQQNRP